MWMTIKHKWFVLVIGRKMGLGLVFLLLHDISKFTPAECFAYGRQWSGDAGDPEAYQAAWLNHQNKNKHHWEYWVSRTGSGIGDSDDYMVEIPFKYLKETAADWFAASRAYEGHWPASMDSWGWYQNNFDKVRVSGPTRRALVKMIEAIIEEVVW